MTTPATAPQPPATARELRIQINTCGSWANLVTVHEDSLPVALTALAALAMAHRGHKPPTFRAIDPAGRVRALDFNVARLYIRELQVVTDLVRQDLDAAQAAIQATAEAADDTL